MKGIDKNGIYLYFEKKLFRKFIDYIKIRINFPKEWYIGIDLNFRKHSGDYNLKIGFLFGKINLCFNIENIKIWRKK